MSRDLKRRRSQSREDSRVRHSRLSVSGVRMSFSGLEKLKEGQCGKCGNEGDSDKEEFRKAGSYETT